MKLFLFKELNLSFSKKDKDKLIDVNSIQPSDFYNFMLHKLVELF